MKIHTTVPGILWVGLAAGTASYGILSPRTLAPVPHGPALYQSRCARCHGTQAQGGPGFSQPLTGHLSIPELAAFIHGAMPPGAKRTPTLESKAIAEYLYNAFYSPIAQDRNRPARVEIARLTVRQFKNCVADLVGNFHPTVPATAPTGLRAEYFNNPEFDGSKRLMDRTDPIVDSNFEHAGPDPKTFDPYQFSVLWSGSVLAPDTGEYEFVVKSNQSVVLYVNDNRKPLIDRKVRSGPDTEFSGSLKLLGGRSYPIRLEFSKSVQGVAEQDKSRKKPPESAFVALYWHRPQHALEPIPTHCLFNQPVAETFVVSVPFPPDDRSIGYERGNSVSSDWQQSVAKASLETANFVTGNLQRITGISSSDKDRRALLMDYGRRFVRQAFRRPLAPDVVQEYVTKQFAPGRDDSLALKRVILMSLMSPRFLYREISGPQPDNYRIASNLSFILWDTLPDSELSQVAESKRLSNSDEIEKQSKRLASDYRAWTKLRDFLLLWFKLDDVPGIVKNPKRFPEFDEKMASDLRTSFEIFLEKTAWSATSDYRDLMLSSKEFLNVRLAKVYGVPPPSSTAFEVFTLNSQARPGVLSQPYLLARFAYVDNTSPIHRGVLITRNLLGRILKQPPAAFTPLAETAHPNFTTRERVAFQTKPVMCNGCHGIINPLGFTLEGFDSMGRIRTQENGRAVNTQGSYLAKNGKSIPFSGPYDLANYLANSDDSHSAFVEKLFQNMTKQPIRAYGSRTLDKLQTSFSVNQCSIRRLMVEVALTTCDAR